jgi:hypothetical protein
MLTWITEIQAMQLWLSKKPTAHPMPPPNRTAPLYVVAILPERIRPEVLSYEAALVKSARTPIVVQAPARTREFAGCGWATIVSIRSCASCFSS